MKGRQFLDNEIARLISIARQTPSVVCWRLHLLHKPDVLMIKYQINLR